MPFIKVEAANVSKEQKQHLIADLTKTAGRILGVDEAAFFVLIKENNTDNWGVGGKTLTRLIEEK